MLICSALLMFASFSAFASEEISISVKDQELLVQRYPAQGKHLIVWIAPGWGSREQSFKLIEDLAQSGIEVWHVDILDSLFLQRSSSSMRGLGGIYVEELLKQAHQQSGKSIVLISRSYGAVPLLRGAREWQLKHPSADYFKGAIIFSPDLYSGAPALGMQPDYLPIVDATNISLVIFQGSKRGNRWQLEELTRRLESGGAQVYVKILKNINSVFFEPSRAEISRQQMSEIKHHLMWTIALLDRLPRPAPGVKQIAKLSTKHTGLDDRLKPFKANPIPLGLSLTDAKGSNFARSDYRGKVTVVNFWATWCGPCVREIPSLNRLRRLMEGTPFELISVNYAESAEEIQEFMKTVNVDFPVLMDSDGQVAANWRVVVFPSTFVIGPSGRIELGANAGLEWDTKEVVDKLKRLLPKKKQ